MEEDYNWTEDGAKVKNSYESTWLPLASKYNMHVEQKEIESGKLRSIQISKNDFMIGLYMSRTSPFDCYYYSVASNCDTGSFFDLFKKFKPLDKSFLWLCEQNNLPIPDESDDKEERWTQWMRNYTFLLEKYCSELLETGDICGWLAKHQQS